MKCKDYHLLMVDELYGEISTDDDKRLQKHLRSCAECRERYESLLSVNKVLKRWPEEEPQVALSFVAQPAYRWKTYWDRLRSLKFVPRLAAIGAFALLILSILNIRVDYGDGHFAVGSALFTNATSASDDKYISLREFEEFRRENYRMVAAIMNEYSRRKRAETALLADELYQQTEQKRREDLQVFMTAVRELQYGTSQRLERTDRTLGTLIQYVNLQSQER